MSVHKKFEEWWNTERLCSAFNSFKHIAEEAYKAGYAAAKRDIDDTENARAADTLDNMLKPTRSTPRTPINEVDY
jgi:hypothetical protein